MGLLDWKLSFGIEWTQKRKRFIIYPCSWCWLLLIVSASSESSEVYSMFYIYISRHHLYCFTLTERVITKRPIGTFQKCFMILLSNSYLLSWLICKFAIKINEVITTTSTLEASIYIKYLTSNNQINRFNKK